MKLTCRLIIFLVMRRIVGWARQPQCRKSPAYSRTAFRSTGDPWAECMVGSSGKVYYKEMISGKEVPIYIAKFEVTKTDANTCQASDHPEESDSPNWSSRVVHSCPQIQGCCSR